MVRQATSSNGKADPVEKPARKPWSAPVLTASSIEAITLNNAEDGPEGGINNGNNS